MATRKASSSTAKQAGPSSTTTKKTTSRPTAERSSAPRAAAPKKKTGMAIAAEAARQLLEMTGRDAEGVIGLEKTEDGWRIEVEVLEVRRIPETTDVLALYELTVDSDGDLEGYRRMRRYTRGSAGEGSG
ncbi:MAG: gas vesicle protein GvpO [Nocardioides sp.]